MNEICNNFFIFKNESFLKKNIFFKKYFLNFFHQFNLELYKTISNSFLIYFLHYNYKFSKKSTLNEIFINLLTRSGLKLRGIITFNYILENFYLLFSKNFQEYNNTFPNYKIFLNISKMHKIYWNSYFFYQLLEQQFYSIFQLKIVNSKISIKTKKKTTKYTTKISYLHKFKRVNWILKNLVTSSIWFENKYFNVRVFYSFLTILLNPSDNFLYKHKINLYKQVLKLKRLT